MGGFVDRRSFLKMFGSSILALFLPKARAGDDPEQRISEFLTSRECSGSEHWSLREPCEALDPFESSAEWTFDPVDALVDPYPTLIDALEEIGRICCDPDLWKMPIEYTIVMSPEEFDWYYENVPWFTSAEERSEELADDPSTYPSFHDYDVLWFPAIAK